MMIPYYKLGFTKQAPFDRGLELPARFAPCHGAVQAPPAHSAEWVGTLSVFRQSSADPKYGAPTIYSS